MLPLILLACLHCVTRGPSYVHVFRRITTREDVISRPQSSEKSFNAQEAHRAESSVPREHELRRLQCLNTVEAIIATGSTSYSFFSRR